MNQMILQENPPVAAWASQQGGVRCQTVDRALAHLLASTPFASLVGGNLSEQNAPFTIQLSNWTLATFRRFLNRYLRQTKKNPAAMLATSQPDKADSMNSDTHESDTHHNKPRRGFFRKTEVTAPAVQSKEANHDRK